MKYCGDFIYVGTSYIHVFESTVYKRSPQ